MADRGTVVWALDPFKTDGGNPRPWLVVSGERMPYPEEESIAVAFTTQSHHADSFAVRELERFVEWAAGERGGEDWIGIVPDDVFLHETEDARLLFAETHELSSNHPTVRFKTNFTKADSQRMGYCGQEGFNITQIDTGDVARSKPD